MPTKTVFGTGKLEFIRNNAWCWETVETDMGFFYIERRGEQFYAFHDATMLHPAKMPLRHLPAAIDRCNDVYKQLKWGDRQ